MVVVLGMWGGGHLSCCLDSGQTERSGAKDSLPIHLLNLKITKQEIVRHVLKEKMGESFGGHRKIDSLFLVDFY